MKRNYELTHDIIARKVWELLPKYFKELRRVRRLVAERARDYYAGKGSPIGAEDLEAWKDYFEQLKPKDQEKSDSKAEAQKEKVSAEPWRFTAQEWEYVLQSKQILKEERERWERQAVKERELRFNAEKAKTLAQESEGKVRRLFWLSVIVGVVTLILLLLTLNNYNQNLLRTAEEFARQRNFEEAKRQYKEVPFAVNFNRDAIISELNRNQEWFLQAQRLDSIYEENGDPRVLPEIDSLYNLIENEEWEFSGFEELKESLQDRIDNASRDFLRKGDIYFEAESWKAAFDCYQIAEKLVPENIGENARKKMNECRKNLSAINQPTQ